MLSLSPSARPTTKYVRAELKEILVAISDDETSAELMQDGFECRRRSTFRLEFLNTEEFKDLDGEEDHSHTSVSTSFST